MAHKVSPWRPLILLAIALLMLLAAGALRARRDFLTRGIVEGLPQPIYDGGVTPGLNVALEQYDAAELDENLRRIASTGVRYIKQHFYYTGSAEFDWSQSERILSAVQQHGLEPAVLLDGNPEENFSPPADLEHFAAWAGEFARRYGDLIRYYFIWDEPNLSSHWGLEPVNAAEYAALLSATSQAVRAADSDAVIVAAPLAPTSETGSANLADVLYLQSLYAAGAGDAFDAVAGKPYGFHSGPDDRRVNIDVLNFSRAILLREVMLQHGDGHKALLAANWGWNALADSWQGAPSIWGQTDAQTRVSYTTEAVSRARREWPWMGLMFLETWEAPTSANDPLHGFDVRGSSLEDALNDITGAPEQAQPGFHLAAPQNPGQEYDGGWRFSPLYGADISETGDRLVFHFWGSSIGLRIRRADYRARLYVTIDGEPAPALPHDGHGAALVLTVPEIEPGVEYLDTVLVADNLQAGAHVMTVEAYRGWDQWALNGFSVGYRPDLRLERIIATLLLFGVISFVALGVLDARRVSWRVAGDRWPARYRQFNEKARFLWTVGAAGLVALAGWLTWGEQAAGIYRRLGDGGQLALTAAAASIFYVAPAFIVYLLALVLLFFFVYARPAWGLAIVAFSFPFYVKPKSMGPYAFSPVEIFILVTVAATLLSAVARFRGEGTTANHKRHSLPFLAQRWRRLRAALVTADYAVFLFVIVTTASLLFTARLDVATNEWRVVIVEPALFYLLLRVIRPSRREIWAIVDAFVIGGAVVAIYGLWQYVIGENVVTVASGLARLSSIYGSPNNVALYLGRVLPFLLAVGLFGHRSQWRSRLYAAALLPLSLALILTFSKGGLFLGVPAGVGIVILLWLWSTDRAIWPWLLGAVLLVAGAAVAVYSIPALGSRLDLRGTTSILRLSLWQASVNMFVENPIFGVGLDNFLYAYRGRYILDSGWEEPYLNHPHNIVLDFATRLGVAGLIAGAWMLVTLLRNIWQLVRHARGEWRAIAAAIAGSAAQMLAHGLVDHSLFLVDLSYVFFFLLGLSTWLAEKNRATIHPHAG